MKLNTITTFLREADYDGIQPVENNRSTSLASKGTFISMIRGLVGVIADMNKTYQTSIAGLTDNKQTPVADDDDDQSTKDSLPDNSNNLSFKYYTLSRLYQRNLTKWFNENYSQIKDTASAIYKGYKLPAFKRIANIPISGLKYDVATITRNQGFWMLHNEIPKACEQLDEQQLASIYIKQFNEMMSYVKLLNDEFNTSDYNKFDDNEDQDFEFVNDIMDPNYHEKLYQQRQQEHEQYLQTRSTAHQIAYDKLLPVLRKEILTVFNKTSGTKIGPQPTTSHIPDFYKFIVDQNDQLDIINGLSNLNEIAQFNIYKEVSKQTTPQLKLQKLYEMLLSDVSTTRISFTLQEKLQNKIKDIKKYISMNPTQKTEFTDDNDLYKKLYTTIQNFPDTFNKNKKIETLKSFIDKIPSDIMTFILDNIVKLDPTDQDQAFNEARALKSITAQANYVYDYINKRGLRDTGTFSPQRNKDNKSDSNNPTTLLQQVEQQHRKTLHNFLPKVPKEQRLSFLRKLISLSPNIRASVINQIEKNPDIVTALISQGKLNV